MSWALTAAMVVQGATLQAQVARSTVYPNVNRPVQIAPGESVVLLNRILVERGPGMRPVRRLEFHYRTSIPAGAVAERQAQAERAAQVFGADALDAGVRTLAIAICDTDACGRREEPPHVWFLYDLRAGNVWKPRKN